MFRYQALARAVGSQIRSKADPHWTAKWQESIDSIMETAPHGSGIDAGVKLSPLSTGETLIFKVGYHHMDESGGYDGWSNHGVIVTPSLELGYKLKITGKDRNGIKEYLGDVLSIWLNEQAGHKEFPGQRVTD